MLVLGPGVQGVSGVGAYFPFGSLLIVEFISDIVVGSFGGLLTEAVDNCHFFGDELLGLCFASGSAEGELGSRRFFALVHLAKGGVDFGVGEFD